LLVEQSKKGITVIIVTHEDDIAGFTQKTIYLRDGKIVEEKTR
jgi:putative ABC transport system ATP-binding protein